MTSIIEIQSVSKAFGRRQAVNQVSLSIDGGEIFGLVGPNGAGKTTTMRMLVTLLQPDSGQIFVNGHSVVKKPEEVRRLLGYMPDSFGLYGNMSVIEYLDFFAACYKIPPSKRPGLLSDLMELVDIAHRRDDSVDVLSRGLKQRLGLARVLIHDPAILVLDEPASGLDPRARVEIRELLLEVARMGKTILFSSHILADVAELCTRVAIIENGKVAALGGIGQLTQQVLPHRLLRIDFLNQLAQPEAEAILNNIPGVSAVRPREGLGRQGWLSYVLEFSGDDAALRDLLGQVLARGLPVVHFSEETQNLEEVFMRATQGIVS